MGVDTTIWTYQAVKSRIIEAADTVQALPPAQRPKEFGNAMPTTVPDYIDPIRYKYRPSSTAISRMEQTWDWINAVEDVMVRKFIYGYAAVKVSKGAKISSFAEENSIQTRGVQRLIDKHCQMLANNLNKNNTFLDRRIEPEVSQNFQNEGTNTSSLEKRGNSWMAPGAKPRHIPKFEEVAK